METLSKTKQFLEALQCPKAKELSLEIQSLIDLFVKHCPKAQCQNKECPCGDKCGVECCVSGCECEKKSDAE